MCALLTLRNEEFRGNTRQAPETRELPVELVNYLNYAKTYRQVV